MTLKILQIIYDASVDDRNNVDNTTHNIVLHKNITFSFNNTCFIIEG
jgi:hypothetical protein